MVNRIKLSQWAKDNGLGYQTAWKMFKDGTLPVPSVQLETGTILVEKEEVAQERPGNRAVVYARVSDSRNRPNLESQASRLEDYCNAKGYDIVRTVKECGSGMNDNRRGLNLLIKTKDSWDILVIEHRDRLTRFGYRYFETFFSVTGNTIDCVNLVEEDEKELMEDLVAFVKSISARMYGLRRTKRRTEEITKELKKSNSEI